MKKSDRIVQTLNRMYENIQSVHLVPLYYRAKSMVVDRSVLPVAMQNKLPRLGSLSRLAEGHTCREIAKIWVSQFISPSWRLSTRSSS